MTAQEIIDYLRVHVLRDSARPYLWSDELMLMYLNEGYSQFCVVTGTRLEDEAYTIALSPGEYQYPLDEDILVVHSAKLYGATYELRNYTRRNLPPPSTTETGTPEAFTTDEKVGYLRVYPTPDTAIDLYLRASADLPELALDDTPLIGRSYHMGLADHVAFRCLTTNDTDGMNVPVTEKHKANFEEFLNGAKRDMYRLRMGNAPTANQNWTGKRG